MKSSINLKTLTSILVILLAVSTSAALASTVTVTVATDKPSYILGDLVTITGTVTEDGAAKAHVLVNVEVRDPAGTLRHADVVKTDADGAFTSSFRLAETVPTGTYTVKAVALGVTGTTTFEVSAVPTFSMIVTPEAIAVPVGWYGVATVELTALAGYNYNVELTYTAPEGITVSFTTPKAVPDFKSMAIVSAAVDVGKGTYTVTITATGEDGTVKTTSLTVAVIEAPPALATLSEKITTLATDVAALSGKIDDLAAKIDKISTAITTLSEKVSALAGDVSTLAGDVADLSAKLDELSTALEELKTGIADLAKDVSVKAEELKTTIGTLEAAVKTLGDTLGKLSAELTTAIGDVKTTVEDLRTDVNELVEGLRTDVNELAKDTDAIQGAMGGLSTAAYAAAILALIAAVASIYAVIVVTRRLA